MTRSVGRRLVLATVLCCLLVGGSVGAVDPSAAEAPGAVDGPSPTAASVGAATPDSTAVSVGAVAAATAQGGNETPRHRHPDEYAEDGDRAALVAWFEDRLESRLESSAERLGEGEHDRARELLGEEYEELLRDYAEVAGDGAKERATGLERARETQERAIEAAAAYEETRAEYERAREAGDDERARRLARELEALAAELNASSVALRDHYGAIEEDAGVDLGAAASTVESIDREVGSTQDEIRAVEFVETTLVVEAESPSISFAEPLVASGRLRTADGEPVANRELRIDVGNQSLSVETDADGAFDLAYRPISVPASTDSLTVAFVPDGGSIYLGAETTVPVSIERVEPTIEVPTVETDRVVFGDRPTVRTAVTVDGEPVDGLPLVVTADGERLGLLETRDGAADGRISIPANVSAGARTLRVALPFEDRALAGASAATTVTVAETDATLSLSASRAGERAVTVNGTLSAADRGVEGQSVGLFVDGTAVGTATTGADGAFGETVTVPAGADAGDVTVIAWYRDDESNLAPAHAAATVSFPASEGLPFPSTRVWLALGGIAALGAGIAGWWYRRRGDSDRAGSDGPGSTPGGRGGTAPSADPSIVPALLSRAADAVGAGRHEEAVQTGYAAARRGLESRLDPPGALTHWEFYRRYREHDAALDAPLESLTMDYERAAFGPGPVSRSEAERVLAAARRICEGIGEPPGLSTDGGSDLDGAAESNGAAESGLDAAEFDDEAESDGAAGSGLDGAAGSDGAAETDGAVEFDDPSGAAGERDAFTGERRRDR